MLNNFVLMCRIVEMTDKRIITNNDAEYYEIQISVKMHDNLIKYQIKRNDLIVIKGHITNDNGLVAEKISFLSSKQIDND